MFQAFPPLENPHYILWQNVSVLERMKLVISYGKDSKIKTLETRFSNQSVSKQ
jgi:hypothetical protein